MDATRNIITEREILVKTWYVIRDFQNPERQKDGSLCRNQEQALCDRLQDIFNEYYDTIYHNFVLSIISATHDLIAYEHQ